MQQTEQSVDWRNRIVGYGEEDADQLLANPFNWRIHTSQQQRAMAGVLAEIGWVQTAIVNRVTGHIVDGHMRASLALKEGAKVPITYVDLTEEEERIVLATYDPIGAMAVADAEKGRELLEGLRPRDEAVREALQQLAMAAGTIQHARPDFDDVVENLKDDTPTKLCNKNGMWFYVTYYTDADRYAELIEMLEPFKQKQSDHEIDGDVFYRAIKALVESEG